MARAESKASKDPSTLKSRIKSYRAGRNGWPHRKDAKLKPEQCALAGFVHQPTPGSRDATVCFLCEKSLNSWTPKQDDPFYEHVKHAPQCAWAALMCVRRGQTPDANQLADVAAEVAKMADSETALSAWNDAGVVDATLLKAWATALLQAEETEATTDAVNALVLDAYTGQSTRMEQLRLATFGQWWPHDGKRGWLVTSKKMAKAGFIYFPGDAAEDTVVCVHCGISLDGWEPKDNPVKEHQKRCAACPFFASLPSTVRQAFEASPNVSDIGKSTTGKNSRKRPLPASSRAESNKTSESVEKEDAGAEGRPKRARRGAAPSRVPHQKSSATAETTDGDMVAAPVEQPPEDMPSAHTLEESAPSDEATRHAATLPNSAPTPEPAPVTAEETDMVVESAVTIGASEPVEDMQDAASNVTTPTEQDDGPAPQDTLEPTVEEHLRQLMESNLARLKQHGYALVARLRELAADARKQLSSLPVEADS
ncbi:hypothetical protein THASP1DRAFT_27271 [Thamnocephalis sphaerospora]|uniref:Inhibitor of Apoptosis domain-containing protein n=1 Tax=Thamnocephalis sphaerospora TaxID=78915 RepID=A0A4P9XY03_9FUNG|nr:hypothetical protein THASP1DRAFT_27271 [Thamnocephalis sphaerospora]|eukprot:RKP10962.1 hypothetical protein THASP1DRAFT_27271 [Thamnocephalis sphaerospora]